MEDDKVDSSSSNLEINPETCLQFMLTRGGGEASTPKCTMTLKHTGTSDDCIAFKVKTTQPRRYLVRPNQGLIRPGESETVSILLVEKDKQLLLQSYDRLGQSALDHSKDKFLVQSTVASPEFASKYSGSKVGSESNKANKDLAEALTSMWNSAATLPVVNKKLHVKHVVADNGTGGGDSGMKGGNSGSGMLATKLPPAPSMDNMTPEQMFSEVSNLRRKYDELVAFSVNLTAERDLLNNTLEQTKRDLNREMALRASLENDISSGAIGQRAGMLGKPTKKSAGFGLSIAQVLILCIAVFYMGIKAGLKGGDSPLAYIPILSKLFEE